MPQGLCGRRCLCFRFRSVSAQLQLRKGGGDAARSQGAGRGRVTETHICGAHHGWRYVRRGDLGSGLSQLVALGALGTPPVEVYAEGGAKGSGGGVLTHPPPGWGAAR